MELQEGGSMLSQCSETPTCIHTTSQDALVNGGRTPLHVVCQRDTDYAVSAQYWIWKLNGLEYIMCYKIMQVQ